jgi:hypothetical protein
MHRRRFVGEMFAIDLNADPDDSRQDERTNQNDKNLRAPSALPGLHRWDFLFHAFSFGSSLAFGWFR